MSITIEIVIDSSLEALWRATQTPALHARWDLRFSAISYLPRPDPALPQHFRYTTRIGFGVAIAGEGETHGQRQTPDGPCTSVLRFWSDDPKSLIRRGSGYWRYIPEARGIRFLTRYDYQTRGGWAGRCLDRALFRPLIAWATAWSFDRLRLWLERGIDPQRALRRSLLAIGARLLLALGIVGALTAGMTPPLRWLALALALALVGALSSPDQPSARRCRWIINDKENRP